MIRFLSIIFFVCLAINKPVFAQSACLNEVFGYSGIKIDRTAATANEAQRLSMADAHHQALRVVLQRLLVDYEQSALEIVPESIVDLVHIRTETSLPGRYIAEIDICFAADQLRALFAEAGLEWAEIASPPILVLPVFIDGAGTRAWQATHPWLSGWRDEANSASGLLQYTTLAPTLQNERQLRAEKILLGDQKTLQKAAMRAQAEQILWVYAAVSVTDGTPQLAMRAIIFDKDGQVVAQVVAQVVPKVADALLSGDKSDYDAQISAFRAEVLARLEAGWKKANLRREGLSNQLVARLLFTTHQELIQKKAALAKLPVINDVETLKISTKGTGQTAEAIVMFDLNGSIDALRYALSPLGLSLSFNDETAVIE